MPLGYPCRFGSANWYNGEPYEGVGERDHLPSDWWDGVFPIPVPGTHVPCGSQQLFQNGWPGAVPAGLPRNYLGLADCCGIIPVEPGGLAAGGDEDLIGQLDTDGIAFGGEEDMPTQFFGGGLSLGGEQDLLGLIDSEGGIFTGGSEDYYGDLIEPGGISLGGEKDMFGYLLLAGGLAIGGPANNYTPLGGMFLQGPGSGTWTVPMGVHLINVHLWGAGGNGQNALVAGGGSGGQGGPYTQTLNVGVTPGQVFTWTVKAGGVSGNSQLQSGFSLNWIAQTGFNAAGGTVNLHGGVPGSGSGPFMGGNNGGGGSSSAGTALNGTNGTFGTFLGPGQGGIAPTGGGNGGNGGSNIGGVNGHNGQTPGGGGGGGGYDGVTLGTKGIGGDGKLLITW